MFTAKDVEDGGDKALGFRRRPEILASAVPRVENRCKARFGQHAHADALAAQAPNHAQRGSDAVIDEYFHLGIHRPRFSLPEGGTRPSSAETW